MVYNAAAAPLPPPSPASGGRELFLPVAIFSAGDWLLFSLSPGEFRGRGSGVGGRLAA